MKLLLTSSLLSCFYFFSYSQKNGVSIIEEVTDKRTFIYAENLTNTPKEVFLKVDAIGYRRRSDRPLIEIISAKSKKLLITLIPLNGIDSNYTYTYIVNDETKKHLQTKKMTPNN